MSSSLRILTFNTQLRSWAMQVGASSGYTIPPIDTAEERAAMIADAIVNSPFDYDIVGLCEVFDEDARAILRKRMRSKFPYMIAKCDYDHLRHESGGGSTTNLALLATWNLIGQPTAITSGYRLEDSGLMLFSRFPFATIGTGGLDPGIAQLCAFAGMPVPAVIPALNFFPYDDTDGNDGDACKGVAYMRVQRDQFSPPYHVFFSHTQADTDKLEEHRDARGKQLRVVGKFIEECVGGWPFTEEVFFMGDLNVSGEQASNAVADREWKDSFETLGNTLSDFMVDLWGRRQCVGAPGLRDPGYSATVRYPPQEQRLDYIFASANSGLAAQHLSIDYALAEVPPGHDDVSYLSDHRPLRLDLARPRPNSTPDTAMEPTFPSPPSFPVFTDDAQWLIEGQVKWYIFRTAGTYDFRLDDGEDRCGFEVYLDTDLSRPRQQYRMEENPDTGKKFVLASAPFLVKVFPFSRDGEQRFSFRAYRHQGQGPWDSIQLPYGVPVHEEFPHLGQRLNDDWMPTPWDDADSKWFRIDGPKISLTRKLEVGIDVKGDGTKFGVALARESSPGVWDLLDRRDGEPAYHLDIALERDEVVHVLVQRQDGLTPGDLAVDLVATTNVSILLGGQRGAPRLMCQDETSGWGADDIAMKITVDGAELRSISNDEIGDFDQDDIRDLNQWIPDLVPYFDGIEFKVIELDDTSPDDIGQQTLRPRQQLDGWDKFAVTKSDDDRTIRGALTIDVDDGTYVAQVSVTTWDEQF